MHIGLIGGIGPAATIVYYQRLVAAMQGAPLDLTIVQADVQTLIKNNLADDRQAQAAEYARLLNRLKSAGADFATITSLGGHFCFDETTEISPLPLVSAVKPLDDYFADVGLNTVGLLGTEVVMRTRLYGQLVKTKAVAPTENMEAVGDAYRDMAVAGTCGPDLAGYFIGEGRTMIEKQGADAIVLAGTDLNLAFDGSEPGYRVVDALDVHVAVLADLAAGRQSLADVM